MKFTQRVYVELDALHDTRYGMIVHTAPWLISKLNFEEYSSRVMDTWIDKIGFIGFKEHWDKRDSGVLKQSPPCALLYELIRELETKCITISLGSPIKKPNLTINTFPYTFTKKEKSQYLVLLDEYYGQFTESIDIIYLDINEVTPTFLGTGYEAAFMYNWREWLGIHIIDLKTNPIPSFVLNGPALLDINSAVEVADQMIEDKINPFEESKVYLASLITLDLFDVGLFSLRLPEKNPCG